MLIRARLTRELPDYDVQEEVDKQTAQSMIEDGKDFVVAIKESLKRSIHG